MTEFFPYENLTWPEVRGDKSPAQYVEVLRTGGATSRIHPTSMN
ncbi:MAG: hypothetical protein HFACDABA_02722 [Anaerolineales bacterium]|nr:hypothetical protein [Anaerolineales bacterium]